MTSLYHIDQVSGGIRLTGELVAYTIGTRLGVDSPDKDFRTDLATYPRQAYHRVFGPTTLPAHDHPKMLLLPIDCIPHVSWKTWDVLALEAWLAKLRRPVYLTYHHEPMGDVDPGTYRIRGVRLAEVVKAYPAVLGTGPCLTRYWLDEKHGNPDDYMYPGATFFSVDCYNDRSDAYRTPLDMFGTAVDLGQTYGVPVLIPEWGVERVAGDPTGNGRAQLMRDSLTYAREVGIAAMAWWNFGGDRITSGPELPTLQTLVDQQ